tara:strand:+ start:2708 stop:2971 length:264 start_codon:yes stop_codon:yes gene_type:complete
MGRDMVPARMRSCPSKKSATEKTTTVMVRSTKIQRDVNVTRPEKQDRATVALQTPSTKGSALLVCAHVYNKKKGCSGDLAQVTSHRK